MFGVSLLFAASLLRPPLTFADQQICYPGLTYDFCQSQNELEKEIQRDIEQQNRQQELRPVHAMMLWPSEDSLRQIAGPCNVDNVEREIDRSKTTLDNVIKGSDSAPGNVAKRYRLLAFGMDDCSVRYKHPVYNYAEALFFTVAGVGSQIVEDLPNARLAMHKAFVNLCDLDYYSMPMPVFNSAERALSIDRSITKREKLPAEACDFEELK